MGPGPRAQLGGSDTFSLLHPMQSPVSTLPPLPGHLLSQPGAESCCLDGPPRPFSPMTNMLASWGENPYNSLLPPQPGPHVPTFGDMGWKWGWEAAGEEEDSGLFLQMPFLQQSVTLAMRPRNMPPTLLRAKGRLPRSLSCSLEVSESSLKMVLSPCTLPVLCGPLLRAIVILTCPILSWDGPEIQEHGAPGKGAGGSAWHTAPLGRA